MMLIKTGFCNYFDIILIIIIIIIIGVGFRIWGDRYKKPTVGKQVLAAGLVCLNMQKYAKSGRNLGEE